MSQKEKLTVFSNVFKDELIFPILQLTQPSMAKLSAVVVVVVAQIKECKDLGRSLIAGTPPKKAKKILQNYRPDLIKSFRRLFRRLTPLTYITD